MVRAPDCGSGGRGFETRLPPQKKEEFICELLFLFFNKSSNAYRIFFFSFSLALCSEMRIFLSIAFVTVLLSKTLYGLFWQINYYVNQQEITALECENKNRPEMHCNGQCYLAKQLQKADEELAQKKSTNERSVLQLKSIESVLFCYKSFFSYNFLTPILVAQNKNLAVFQKDNYHFQPTFSVFHPPCL